MNHRLALNDSVLRRKVEQKGHETLAILLNRIEYVKRIKKCQQNIKTSNICTNYPIYILQVEKLFKLFCKSILIKTKKEE